MLIDTLAAARDLGRLNEIAGVLIRHGFGDTVRRLGLADALASAGHALHREHAADLARLSPPEQVRSAFEELGPTFVKLGQLLAGRADLFGPEWIREFEKLHSRVPALPLDALREQLRADLGGEPEDVFAEFEAEAMAGASIAQVHRARLKDGTAVVVKVRRPGIVERIDADLRLLERLAHAAHEQLPALRPYGPVRLVRELARSLRRELDLAAECRHAERIARNLSALPFVTIPRVFWAHTNARVNVQQRIEGIPGHELQRLRGEGLDPPLLARRGAQAVLKMIVEDGFFHADPHPGNVFYQPGNRLAFIDFGMVGRLSPRRREELLQLLLGLVQHQPQDVVDVLLDWTADNHGPTDGPDIGQLENEIESFVDQYQGTPLAQLSLGSMLQDVTAILREHHLALPADLALLIKAFVSLESMGRGLDPDFHMTTEALPLLRHALRERYRPKAFAQRSWQTLRRAMGLLERLPHDASQLLRKARRGKLQVHLDLQHLRRVGDQIDRAASRLAIAFVIAGLVVGSSIVMTVGGGPTLLGLPAFGLVGFVTAVLAGVWLVHSIRRGGRHEDDPPRD
jgi:ubiquinone biosynthesis protein